MLDPATIGAQLDAVSEGRLSAARSRELRTLRGVRGTPDGALAALCATLQKTGGVNLDGDRTALQDLFSTAFEDGIVAIALVAAALPDDAEAAWEIGGDWLERVDDPLTADALGTMILGPASLATGRAGQLADRAGDAREEARRARVAACEAWLGAPIKGPAAAALRERLGTREVRFVETTQPEAIGAVLSARVRDESPTVRKALRRVLHGWTQVAPAEVVAWADGVKGGMHSMLGEEVARARRKARAATEA